MSVFFINNNFPKINIINKYVYSRLRINADITCNKNIN